MNDNIIRCQADGTWDFGDLRCEGTYVLLTVFSYFIYWLFSK